MQNNLNTCRSLYMYIAICLKNAVYNIKISINAHFYSNIIRYKCSISVSNPSNYIQKQVFRKKINILA